MGRASTKLAARLLWLDDYRLVFAAEAALHAPLLASLMETYVSAHTTRLMRSDTPEGALGSSQGGAGRRC